ncbi:thioredoxin family protein [Enterococcus olivae]
METTTFDNVQKQITKGHLLLLYVSMANCSVCHAVKPRIEKLFQNHSFPVLHLEAEHYPEVAGAFQVMTAPVILGFFNGKEIHRQARFIDFNKLEKSMENYQSLDLSVTYDDLFN